MKLKSSWAFFIPTYPTYYFSYYARFIQFRKKFSSYTFIPVLGLLGYRLKLTILGFCSKQKKYFTGHVAKACPFLRIMQKYTP